MKVIYMSQKNRWMPDKLSDQKSSLMLGSTGELNGRPMQNRLKNKRWKSNLLKGGRNSNFQILIKEWQIAQFLFWPHFRKTYGVNWSRAMKCYYFFLKWTGLKYPHFGTFSGCSDYNLLPKDIFHYHLTQLQYTSVHENSSHN